tara:strand:+ start:86 stop:484 length:399 start_codon:yes stop_codon:yes gene_type:complete
MSGYKVPYEPWGALKKLASNRSSALDELWENLYHQGDVGTASYAAVPELVENEALDLVATIEVSRNNGSNPELPAELEASYMAALQKSISKTPSNLDQLKAYYSIHASINKQHELAEVLDFISVEEIYSEIN